MTTQPAVPGRDKTIREQIELLSLAEGFFSSSVLFALQRMKIFPLLEFGEKTSEELAQELGCRADTLQRLLSVAVMLKLLQHSEGKYGLTAAARAVLLPSAKEGYLGDWIELMEQFSVAYTRLDQAVMTSGPSMDPQDYLGGDQARTKKYIYAMHNYAATRGKDLARYLDMSNLQSVLDLGCGPGTFGFHLASSNPKLRLTLADLPWVLEVTREIQASYSLPNPIDYLPLDAGCDAIPGEYDLVLASNFLQCFDEVARTALLGRIYQAVRPGGSLVVQAQHLQSDRQGGRWALFVDLNLLCTTEHGRNHTMDESAGWLEEAGFINIERNSMSVFGTTSFVRGYRPS
jgi:8-O-methyltransferase